MSTVLEDWQAEVEGFGGRINSPSQGLHEELGKTVLGAVKSLPTSGAQPILGTPITLAEMVVSRPIAVDVSFSYPNLIEGSGIGAPLFVGDGYVQITWGVKGATKQVAKVDGNAGWRFPFVASQLLVQYFPIDSLSTGGRVITVGQPRDLQIAAMIAPASGAPCAPLTKTLYFPDVAPGAAAQQQTPLWSSAVRTSLVTNIASTYGIDFFDSSFNQMASMKGDGVSGQYPTWQLPAHWWPVPQGGVITNLSIDAVSPIGLIQPRLIFRLAL